jgi:hypothetical protein
MRNCKKRKKNKKILVNWLKKINILMSLKSTTIFNETIENKYNNFHYHLQHLRMTWAGHIARVGKRKMEMRF